MKAITTAVMAILNVNIGGRPPWLRPSGMPCGKCGEARAGMSRRSGGVESRNSSDLYRGTAFRRFRFTARRQPGKPAPAERPGGGDAAGQVVEVGAGVSGFKPGDRVMGGAPRRLAHDRRRAVDGLWRDHLPPPARPHRDSHCGLLKNLLKPKVTAFWKTAGVHSRSQCSPMSAARALKTGRVVSGCSLILRNQTTFSKRISKRSSKRRDG